MKHGWLLLASVWLCCGRTQPYELAQGVVPDAGLPDSGCGPEFPQAKLGDFEYCREPRCSRSPNGPRVTGVVFRFGCGCDPNGNPPLDVRLEVSDPTTPTASMTTMASIMGCEHLGYQVSGTEFSATCRVSLWYARFDSAWNIMVTDDEGNAASVFVVGPEYCKSERVACRPDLTDRFSYICER
jgi:hypothetical protein